MKRLITHLFLMTCFLGVSAQTNENPTNWKEWLTNGDAETPWKDATVKFNDQEKNYLICAWGKEKGVNMNDDGGWDPFPATIESEVVDGKTNHFFIVHGKEATTEGDASAWDNQFWIQSPKSWKEGEQLKIHFRYKASKNVKVATQCNKQTPFDYLIWHAIGDINFTTEWQEFDGNMTIGSDMGGTWSIAFQLNQNDKEAIDFYFDDLSWQSMKLDEGLFVAASNSATGIEYDFDNAIEFTQAGNLMVATVGTKGMKETWVNELMISTVRGNNAAFKGATIKPTGTIFNDPDIWLDYTEASNAKIKLPEDGVWTISIDTEGKQINVVKVEGKEDMEPVAICYNYIVKAKIAEVVQNPSGKYTGNIIIPETVMHEGVEYTVTKIADNAFSGCSGIRSITIPQSITSIGSGSFDGCSGLNSVNISDLAAWCKIDFGTIKYSGYNNPLKYAHHLYLNGQEIENLVIPNGILSISEQSFYGCTGLTSVTIGNTVTSIGDYAFSGCTCLSSLNIGNNVTSIGSYAFQNCTGISSISIPHSVISIGDRSFYGCAGLTSVTIGNSVKTIGYYAFLGCKGLSSIILPNSLTNIGVAAFKDCTGLTSVNIPIGVTRIEIDAFNGCSGLISIIIGDKVSSIETRAFCNCPNLTDFYCSTEKVPNTNADAFKDSYTEYATLHVPATSLNDYNNAEPWKNFKEIVALDGGDIPEMEKCATPAITFENGKITFTCETEGAEFISTITPAEINKKYDSEIVISNTYKVTVYATKVGYIDSDKATIEIHANSGVFGDLTGDGVVNVADHVKLSSIIMEQSE